MYFRDSKSGQEELHIGAALGISNRDKKITNWSKDFKLGQRDFKLGHRLQIGAREIANRGRVFKSVQGLQICAEEGQYNCEAQTKIRLFRYNNISSYRSY